LGQSFKSREPFVPPWETKSFYRSGENRQPFRRSPKWGAGNLTLLGVGKIDDIVKPAIRRQCGGSKNKINKREKRIELCTLRKHGRRGGSKRSRTGGGNLRNHKREKVQGKKKTVVRWARKRRAEVGETEVTKHQEKRAEGVKKDSSREGKIAPF